MIVAPDSFKNENITFPQKQINRESKHQNTQDQSMDISIRSDKEGQSVYGPSLAPMEETV